MASRDIGVFLRDVVRKAPTPFPYIAGFHLLMFLYVFIYWWGMPISYYYVEILWMLGFTACWLYICDLKRWAVYGYIGLTLVNIILYAYSLGMPAAEQKTFQTDYISSLLVPALIFCLLVLVYFKKLKEDPANTHKIDAP